MASRPRADSRFLSACRGNRPDRVPVWFMRQAGRSLPEYRALRGEGSILEAIEQPELAAELTLQPVRRLGVDAAILFSDIVVPLVAAGVELEIKPEVGPVVAEPVRDRAALAKLHQIEPEVDMWYVLEAVRLAVAELEVPLIAFGAAPFTLATYLVEGGASRHYLATKSLMRTDPVIWGTLLERLADIVATALSAQVAAGASAIQVFDSWAGILAPSEYRQFVLPPTRRLFERLEALGVPVIHFGLDAGELLRDMAAAGGDVIGVDWRVPLDQVAARVGREVPVQGNLDPSVCLCPWGVVQAEARRVLEEGSRAKAHVFNLGHGVLPETDPGLLGRLVEFVHAWEPTGPKEVQGAEAE